ncbi:MAG TPA: HAD family hydrolase [Firmicutes bacterium]|nr:HAD family hydrolase [Candidatus Fermentithermobacillaceae bacterium]
MKAVFFDLGGTLWAPFGDHTKEEVVESAARRAAERLPGYLLAGLSPDEATRLRREFELSLMSAMSDGQSDRSEALKREDFAHASFAEITVDRLVGDIVRRLFGKELTDQSTAAQFGRDLTRYSTPYSESERVLARLKAAFPGIRIGVVSNTAIQPHIIDEFLVECRLQQYLDFRVYSSAVGWRKPHPAIYEAALKEAGVLPHEVVFVGDSVFEDVRGPQLMGMKAVFCKRRPLDEDTGADAVVEDLVPIPELVKRFAAGK